MKRVFEPLEMHIHKLQFLKDLWQCTRVRQMLSMAVRGMRGRDILTFLPCGRLILLAA